MHLVTGATGHIGNILIRQLLARGEHVRAMVRPGGIPEALTGLTVDLVPGDLLDPRSLTEALLGVEYVYHLGARISLGPGSDPETWRVNLEGTRNLVEAALNAGIQRFLYASSIYSLRRPVTGLVDETLPFDPASAYGDYDRSKAAASLEVLSAVEHGLDAVLLCPTAVTGPFDFKNSESGRAIKYNMPPGIKFTVDGGYDFVDVRDVAKGFIRAAEIGRRGETYILGGERLTVREVSKLIWQAAGGWHWGIHLPGWMADLAAGVLPLFSQDPLVTPYTLGAIRSNSYISHAKAAAELGYQPRPAATAVREAVRWWQERKGGSLEVGQPGGLRGIAPD
jgi:dihydroflavonol-4-reductase